MMSHDLAKLLLKFPDTPIATHANNHTDSGKYCRVGISMHGFGDGRRILIGNFSRKRINYPNEYILEVIDGGEDVPENWPRY